MRIKLLSRCNPLNGIQTYTPEAIIYNLTHFLKLQFATNLSLKDVS